MYVKVLNIYRKSKYKGVNKLIEYAKIMKIEEEILNQNGLFLMMNNKNSLQTK